MKDYVASKDKSLQKLYFFYTTCPKCAKHYGKNYVVLLAQVYRGCDEGLGLEGDSEIGERRIAGDGGRFHVANVPGKRLLNIRNAVVHVLFRSLDEQFNRSIGQVPHKPTYIITLGDVMGCVAKPHPLDMSLEDDVFGGSIHESVPVCS